MLTNNYKGSVLIGFYNGTILTKYPHILKMLSDAFEKENMSSVFIGDAFLDDMLYIPLSTHCIEPKTELILSVEEREIWINRCNNSWRDIESDKVEDVVLTIERNAMFLLNKLTPTCFIGWNTLEYKYGIVADVARKLGIKVFSIETGPILQSLRCDLNNLATPILFPNFNKYYVELGNEILKNIEVDKLSLYNQNNDLYDIDTIDKAKDEGKRIVLVLGTLESDCGVFPEYCIEKEFVLPGFKNSYDVATTASLSNQDFVVFKPHPVWKSQFPGCEEQNSKIFVSETDSLLLIDKADLIVNITGKLIMPLVLKRKNIINIGNGFFSGLELGLYADSKETLTNLLVNKQTFNSNKYIENIEFAIGYLYSTNWILFPNTEITIPKGCLSIELFVKNLANHLIPIKVSETSLLKSIIYVNNTISETKPTQYKENVKTLRKEISLKFALRTIFSLKKWKSNLINRLKLIR